MKGISFHGLQFNNLAIQQLYLSTLVNLNIYHMYYVLLIILIPLYTYLNTLIFSFKFFILIYFYKFNFIN